MGRLKILIIEDESIISIHIKQCIIKLGHEVIGVVKDSSSALALADREKFDLAFVDINIDGDIDGIQVAKILNKTYNIPIVFLTGQKDLKTIKRANEVEFIGYILKPFREDEIEAMINLTIVKHQLNKDDLRIKIDDRFDYCSLSSSLYKEDKKVDLTVNENKLLKLLINAKGQIVPYSDIENVIWYNEPISDSARRKLFQRLKNKLKDFPIYVIKGKGYRVDTLKSLS